MPDIVQGCGDQTDQTEKGSCSQGVPILLRRSETQVNVHSVAGGAVYRDENQYERAE